LGNNASSSFLNSVAIGNNANSTKDNQIVLGATGVPTTYTLPGLAPNGAFINSANQNLGETRFTTSDNQGNLGTSSFSVAQLNQALSTINSQIQNVGALAAALSAIPNLTSENNKYGCGIGTGAYGSGWAGAIGCSAKLSSNIWINGALAFTGSNETHWGSTPPITGRLGLFWQWGAPKAPTTSSQTVDTSPKESTLSPLNNFKF